MINFVRMQNIELAFWPLTILALVIVLVNYLYIVFHSALKALCIVCSLEY